LPARFPSRAPLDFSLSRPSIRPGTAPYRLDFLPAFVTPVCSLRRLLPASALASRPCANRPPWGRPPT
jgi:hypothetical protein